LYRMMFCWGDASRGQLLSAGAELSASCGEQHAVFVSEGGRVFSCGRNSKGQLGRAKSKETKVPGRASPSASVSALY
uniref:Uncharacterized protein n=1 Tax=Pygocentrus nattereri TaxID=42514 RepID=A0AAR2JN29_PYGNA